MHEKLQGSVCVSGGDSYLLCWHMETQESMNRKHVASMLTINLMKQIGSRVWTGDSLYHHMGLVVEVRLSCCLVLLSTDRKAGRQDGRASTTQPMYSTDYALMRHLGHNRLCEHACSLLIWEWSRADRHIPGSPSPLTGLRLWQDPVRGGWLGIVYGCVLLSPCDHARLLVVLWIYYLIYCSYDCTLVMMNILKT